MSESRLDMGAIERAFDMMAATFGRGAEIARAPVEEWVAEVEREQFDTEGVAGASGRWSPLARSTVEQKTREGYGSRRILERTGAMRAALTSLDSIRSLVEVSGDRIIFRLPTPASYHQVGDGRGTYPARPVFDPSGSQRARLRERLQKAAAEELRRQGLPVKG
jgi:hypothetical protein